MLIVIVVLIGCATKRVEIPKDSGFTQAPVARSQISFPASESFGSVQIIGGDEQTLREFIIRWTTPMYAIEEGDTIITMGGLPESLLVHFPLPEESQVFASIQSATDLQVFLDIPKSSEDVLVSYPQLLGDAEWKPVSESSQSGFVSATDQWLVFCNDESQTALTIQVFPKTSQETDLRVSLYTKNGQYMCDPDTNQGMDPAYCMLPVLKMPPQGL